MNFNLIFDAYLPTLWTFPRTFFTSWFTCLICENAQIRSVFEKKIFLKLRLLNSWILSNLFPHLVDKFYNPTKIDKKKSALETLEKLPSRALLFGGTWKNSRKHRVTRVRKISANTWKQLPFISWEQTMFCGYAGNSFVTRGSPEFYNFFSNKRAVRHSSAWMYPDVS